jgi:ATP-dependent helicase HrpA
MLNRLPADRLEWLVPALLEEKVTALIRGLPKTLRRHFVPVPDFAAACVERLSYGAGSLREALAAALAQMADVTIPADALNEATLPPHLRLRIEVLGDDGRPLGAGRDLEALRRDLAASATESFGRLSDDRFDRAEIRTWDFGDLPERVEVTRGGARLVGFPALLDEGETAGLRLLDSEDAATVATRRGLRRLFTLACEDELRFHVEHLPGVDEMRVAYAALGPAEDLADGLVALIVERAFLADDASIRREADFRARLDAGWRQLGEATFAVADLVESILRERHELELALDGRAKPVWAEAVADARTHLARLLPAGFLVDLPFERLAHAPRYLQAARRRLEKLAGGALRRDAEHVAEIAARWAEYEERRADHAARGVHDPALETYRWMLEELRVSLFAQELRTAVPISPKRLDEQWARVQG